MNLKRVFANLVASATILTGCSTARGGAFAGAAAPSAVETSTSAGCAIPCTASGTIDPVWLRQVQETLRHLVFGHLVRGRGWLGLGVPMR